MPEPVVSPPFSLPAELVALGGSLSTGQLVDVLRAEQSRRWRSGQRVPAETYLEAFPALATSVEDVLVLVWGEVLLRWEIGEEPRPDEYHARFPQHAEALALQFDLQRHLGTETSAGQETGEETVPVTLEVLAGPHKGGCFSFDRAQTFLVGRAPDVDLQLIEDGHFSRHHFVLEVNPPRCTLRDLGSSNGTFVNGQRVTECQLRDGDVISGGKTRIRIALPDGSPLAEASTVAPGFVSGSEGLAAPPTLPGPTPARAAPVLVAPGYTVEGQLGRGGMGVVYLARRQATGERCALKVILPESAADERAMKLFLREVSVLSQLDHPRIVRFLEIGMHRGQFFFAMQYVETTDLRTELTARPPGERVALACGLVCQVLEGLQHAHERGFVHRDIKPANLLVSREGGRLSAFLADFGLAKDFQNAGFSGMTGEGMVVGTVAFMAPEQVAQARLARPAVDIYAMGATLYHLLTERTPHDLGRGQDPLAVIAAEDAIPPRRHCPWLPEGLEAVILKALARDPASRFLSAEAMRQALLPYAGH